MRPGAHVAAAIEVFEALGDGRVPVAQALKEWGRAHRFAGSKDRAAISGLVYDMLRRRASASFVMGGDDARAVALGTLALSRGATAEELDVQFEVPHSPEALSDDERSAIGNAEAALADAPDHIRADMPDWLFAELGSGVADPVAEGAALATRAPVDIRVNTLKSDAEKVAKSLPIEPEPTALAPNGLRLRPPAGGARIPDVSSSTALAKGWAELQDEGSQIAAALANAQPGEQVLDLCAGAGGKTLALAAAMDNKGQIYAFDADTRRLAPIHDRLARSGARNVQVRAPGRRGTRPTEALDDLEGKLDLVLVDAPCTGSGTWRRNPDAKWRVRPMALERRQVDQDEVLAEASRLVKPGGRIVYVTCSLFRAENEARVEARLAGDDTLEPGDAGAAWESALGKPAPEGVVNGAYARVSPHTTNTDGFFIAVLNKRS